MGEKKHDDPSVVVASHHAALTSVLGSSSLKLAFCSSCANHVVNGGSKDEALSSIIYSYKHGFSGFAAKLTPPQAEELTKHPGVVSVKPNTYHRVHTTRSWDFLVISYGQQPSSSSSSPLLRKAKYGEDVIVGVIDSGIWPESRSFDDSGYGPVPKRWKGMCQTGQAFNASNCNRKVIGARWYGADAREGALKSEYKSARDANGHGTHIASTIAGSPVQDASHAGGGLAAGLARAAGHIQGPPRRRRRHKLRRRVDPRGSRRRHRGWRRRAVHVAGSNRRDVRDVARRGGQDHRDALRRERRPRGAVRRQRPAVGPHGGRRHRGSHLPDSHHARLGMQMDRIEADNVFSIS